MRRIQVDPDNLDVNVRGDEDDGFRLHVRMFYPVADDGGVALRQAKGSLTGEDGPWDTEDEAQEAAEDLRTWWENQ